ncbi:hypothetical protein [Streptomyces clavuligerus]|uniref:Uncharacterized protein n=1 Tax=Streptomyces clavuligerus TaxID=1901 RepID=E2Q7D0_STRCL|nr:hypothetical protein [Streptomyces clavuligerus]ANW19809.1 hypothetical protein BB341_17070 [Streptomyces clavuligerus]AXU14424.1 hypothetical protein D1794_17830 [Streptomyces clavuligerus]EFG07336.1 Hypothetical protein SCLAV_2263 [Streptomyces clavuligerus]MBY6304432.1 hypothetical protein [Streptomyces clavuligerus]QCS07198.1 hypothetical protein CRV15_17185 [Streptomyces clavuligerus]
MHSWHFVMHTLEPFTPEQSDTIDGLDSFADGFLGPEEGPGYSKFVCYFPAESLRDAMVQALERVAEVPGVLIRSIELTPHSLDHNGMATPAVVPAFEDPVV